MICGPKTTQHPSLRLSEVSKDDTSSRVVIEEKGMGVIPKEISSTIRLVTLDLDGTVVGRGGVISERTRAVVARLQEAGVSVALATGRPWFGARSIAETFKITSPSLFYSGALILNPATGEVHQECFIEPTAVREVLVRATERGLYTELYTRNGYFSGSDSEFRAIHTDYLGSASEIASLVEVAERYPILKFGFVVTKGEGDGALKALFQEFPELASSSAFGASHPDILFGNMTSRSASREGGFALLCSLTGVEGHEVASFGDGDSDIPFLRLAGLGVAMGNAPLSVKEAAEVVTGTVEDDGAAAVLEQLLSRSL